MIGKICKWCRAIPKCPVWFLCALLMLVTAAVTSTQAHAQVQADLVLRVDIVNGEVTGDGSDWNEDAFKFLQDALSEANTYLENPQHVDHSVDIWVAAGTYLPTQGVQDTSCFDDQTYCEQCCSFRMRNNVRLYGGFAGSEDFRHERDPAANETILSGDLGTENSRTIVRAENVNESAMINGFTLTGAGGSTITGYAAMVMDSASPLVIRCRFIENQAQIGAGLTIMNDTPSTAHIINCEFIENSGTSGAGGVAVLNTTWNVVFVNCLFYRNNPGPTATTHGGAVFLDNTHATFRNCTWNSNTIPLGGTTPVGGAAIQANASQAVLLNCVLWSNTTGDPPHGTWAEEIVFPGYFAGDPVGLTFVLNNTCIRGYDEGDLGGVGNIDDDPLFVDENAGDLRLSPNSPAITRGDNALTFPDVFNVADAVSYNPNLATPDLDLQWRIRRCLVDMGAYEQNVLPDCPGDLTGNGFVDVSDLLALLNEWGPCEEPFEPGGCPADLTGDCAVDISDLLALLGNWGDCESVTTEAPPTTVEECLNRYEPGSSELEKCLLWVEEQQHYLE